MGVFRGLMILAARLFSRRILPCRGLATKKGIPWDEWSSSQQSKQPNSEPTANSTDRKGENTSAAPTANSAAAHVKIPRPSPVQTTTTDDVSSPAPKQPVSTPTPQDQHAVFVDGFALIYRSYYATPSMLNSAGEPVNALNVFCKTLFKLMKRFDSATHFAVMLDCGASEHRTAIYPGYKGHRKPTPDDLKSQLPLIEKLLEVSGIPALKCKGWEADDLIATYTAAATAQEAKVTIITGDKDLCQVVNSNVQIFNPYQKGSNGTKGAYQDVQYVKEQFGVPPEQVVHAQALAGDAADAVPGVKGIGPKTAGKLIAQFGTVEATLSAAQDEDKSIAPKLRQKLLDDAEMARLSFELVQLRTDFPLEVPYENLRCDQRSHRWREDTISWLSYKGLWGIVKSKQNYF